MVYLITGKMNSFKTKRTIEIALSLPASDGFVSLKTMNNNEVVQYDLMKLSTKELKTLAIHKSLYHHSFNHPIEFGPYVFDSAAFDWAEHEIIRMIEHNIATIFIDEVGILEIEGKGFFSSIEKLLRSKLDCYFTIRDQFIPSFLNRFKITHYQILS